MNDALTLAALGADTMNEAVRFLFAQASELLSARRHLKTRDKPQGEVLVEIAASDSKLLERPLARHRISVALIDQELDELTKAIAALRDANGAVRQLAPDETSALTVAEQLREILERLYGESIVFLGEKDPRSRIHVRQQADAIGGEMTGVKMLSPLEGDVSVEQNVRLLDKGGRIVGYEGD
jgi:hypothetical protein